VPHICELRYVAYDSFDTNDSQYLIIETLLSGHFC